MAEDFPIKAPNEREPVTASIADKQVTIRGVDGVWTLDMLSRLISSVSTTLNATITHDLASASYRWNVNRK